MKGETCWMCGTDKNVTRHHVIPKSFNPKKNMIIPLCRSCHDKIHRLPAGNVEYHREVIHFNRVKQNDGSYKLQSTISNGKVCFVDRSEGKTVKPLRKYDCKIKEMENVAFALDIHEVNLTILEKIRFYIGDISEKILPSSSTERQKRD